MKKYLMWILVALYAAVAFIAFTAFPARAANCSSYSFTLTNGQVADATQVMANFNNILSCANNNLAKNGANSDITSISGLLTPLSASQGGTGVTTGVGIDVYFFVGGLTGNSWIIGAYQPSMDIVLTNAKARCVVAGAGATGTTTYTLKDNGSTIGTAVVTAGGTSCAATLSSSPTTVLAGHTLTLTGPTTGDATLTDIGITFGGVRQ